ncbi:MAG: TonB family protein [Alistipes sp.]
MNDYKEDKCPRRWAIIALLGYAMVLAVAFFVVTVGVGRVHEAGEVILIDFPEPPVVPPQVEPPMQPSPEPIWHEQPDKVEQNNQVKGADKRTETVNPKALFKQSSSGTDEPENAGNPFAKQGDEEQAKGSGSGLKPFGSDQLDKGLQGRGLAGSLPRPDYPGNVAGKVLIRVTVDKSGKVTAATYEPTGSTTSDADLVEAARRAAFKARFTESSSFVQGGTITYVFKLN